MIILGLDPGTAVVGYGIIDQQKNKYQTLDFGVLRTNQKLTDSHRLGIIFDGVSKLIKKHQPDLVAVESLFFFKNQKTVMTVSQARGVILLAVQKQKIPLIELTPLQVKQALTSYGRAEKDQMQRMVKLLLGLEAIPKPDDAADALACAIAASQVNSFLSKI